MEAAVKWFPCVACTAKDAEITRLDALVQALVDRSDRHASEVLKPARDATGLTPPPAAAPPPDPLPAIVDDFLLVKFGVGTREYYRQVREARKLLTDGLEPLEVNERLKRGQQII